MSAEVRRRLREILCQLRAAVRCEPPAPPTPSARPRAEGEDRTADSAGSVERVAPPGAWRRPDWAAACPGGEGPKVEGGPRCPLVFLMDMVSAEVF